MFKQPQSKSQETRVLPAQRVMPRAARPLPPVPITKAVIPHTQRFFQPLPPDFDVHQAFRVMAGHPEDLNDVKIAMRTWDIDPMATDDEGYNALHYAALTGNAAFFDFILTDPSARLKANVDTFNIIEKRTALSLAIENSHFELALKLIREYGANINVITRWQYESGKIDNTFGILRKAFLYYFNKLFLTLTDEKKLSLQVLCQELASRGLSFFITPGSSCPPVFEGAMSFTITPQRHEERLRLNEKQYLQLLHLRHLKNCSSIVHDLLIADANATAIKSAEAQEILTILTRVEIDVSPNSLTPLKV